jgi:hypothetical protein
MRGRPAKYKNPPEMEAKIEEYFAKCDAGEEVERITKKGDVVKIKQKIPYNVHDLALHLGFASTQSLDDYCKRNRNAAQFAETITRARTKILGYVVRGTLSGQLENRSGTLVMQSMDKTYSSKVQVEAKGIEDLLREAHEAGK